MPAFCPSGRQPQAAADVPRLGRLFLLAAVFALTVSYAHADGVSDANAGVEALNRGDYGSAVRLFTQAIEHGKLSSADTESAYLERAKAYMGQKNNPAALHDVAQALSLEPNDAEAISLRNQMQTASSPSASDGDGSADTLNAQVKANNDAIDAKFLAAQASYKAELDKYETEKRAAAAQKNANDSNYASELAAWQAKVAACKNGDHSQCGN